MGTTTKTCTVCRVLLPMSSFYKSSSSKDKLSYRCKSCDFKASSKSREKNIEKRREKQREYSKLNRKATSLRMRRWRLNNPDRDKANQKKHYQENKDKYSFRSRVRKGVRRQATPEWLSKDQKEHIESIYFFRRAVSGVVGREYHVDHIVPLKGDNVCGLHVPWNLQVIPAKDNLSKSNSVDHLDTF